MLDHRSAHCDHMRFMDCVAMGLVSAENYFEDAGLEKRAIPRGRTQDEDILLQGRPW